MRSEKLPDILNSLPERAPTPARLAADVIPLLSEAFGFSREWVRFEYSHVPRLSTAAVIDAAIVDPERERPIVVFEVKARPFLSRWGEDDFRQLDGIVASTGAMAGVLLTYSGMIILGPEIRLEFVFGSTTAEDLDNLQVQLRRLHSQWLLQTALLGPRRPPSRPGRPGDRPECERRLQAVREAVTNDDKKRSLEGLVQFLIGRTDNLLVKYTDLRTASSEIDLIVENRGKNKRHTMFDEFGRHFLVECKNWSSPIGAKEVRDFVGKLLKTKIRLGVLVTRKGVTGSDGGEDALREIHFCFDVLNTAVLVLADEDLEALCAGADLHDWLDKKLDRLRFDLP